MTDDLEQKDTVVRGAFGPAYRRFITPEEAKLIKDGKVQKADVIEIKKKDPRETGHADADP